MIVFQTLFLYILPLEFMVLGCYIIMQTDPTIKKVGEVLDLKKKYKLLYPHNLFWLMYGSFIIIFYLVFPKRIAYILCRIVYGAAGAICLFIAIVAVYMIITEGDSIIADVKSGNWE